MAPVPDLTSLGLEYFISDGDNVWRRSDSQLIEMAIAELSHLRLVERGDVIDGTVRRVKKAYPVYDSTYQRNLSIVRDYLGHFRNFQTVGRNGLHKYNNQDHSMITALMAAGNLLGERHDVWAVNSDRLYHEETE